MSDSIKRRQFLLRSAAVPAVFASSGLISAATETQIAESIDSNESSRADVVVVGGGTAGTIAAIAAARAGAKTILVERGSQLGGTSTIGGVNFPGLFHAWGKQIIAGIGWELVNKSVELDGGKLPDFTKPTGRHWQLQVTINQFLYSALAEEACLEAGVTIRYYEFPQVARATDGGWQLELAGPGTRHTVEAAQLIDCTGGADVVGLAGLERMREKETQPGSMLFKTGDAFSAGRERLEAVYVHGADSSTSVTRTHATLTGRQAMLAKIRKDLAKRRLVQMQTEAAFRESYRIRGETIITVDDYTSGRHFDDAVSYAFYPVDLHTRSGVRPKPLAEGIVPTIPLRALIPAGSRNVMVAGRSISSDRLANSGLRVQAPCMAMGQAAGATCALAAKKKTTPLEVPLADIHSLLKEYGAIVP